MSEYWGNNVPKCKNIIQRNGPGFDFTITILNKNIKYQVKKYIFVF